MPLDLSPSPAAGGRAAMLRAQSRLEIVLALRNGEQVLLTLVIPVVLLLALGATDLVDLGSGGRIPTALAGMLAVAVLSSAFTGPAIGVGFDRRSGALRLLGTTPLTRTLLLGAKTIAILAVEVIQVVLLLAVAALLGWRPGGNAWATVVLLVLATAAFSSLGLALAGLLRAEATLAVANAIFLLLLLGGGTALPTDRLPSGLGAVAGWLPSGALGNGLRSTLAGGHASLSMSAIVLIAWTFVGTVTAARTFKWE